MFAKIKLFGMFALSIAAAILYGLWNREKYKRQKEHAMGLIKKQKVEGDATKAMVEGLNNEQKAVNDLDTSKRDHFS